MLSIYRNFIFEPLYNLLVLLFDLIPWADAGIIVILLTVIVRLLLFPLSRKAVRTQMKMQEIAPLTKEINEKYKNSPEEKARKTLELYRQHKLNPFSSIFVILLQLPILLALYQIFLHAGFPQVDLSILYSFIPAPDAIETTFLGSIDITSKSATLAFLAAVTTYFQFKVSLAKQKPSAGDSFGDNLARSMQVQMKYFFPIIVFFISYSISGVIALYWLTTNLFTIVQELVIRRKLKTQAA